MKKHAWKTLMVLAVAMVGTAATALPASAACSQRERSEERQVACRERCERRLERSQERERGPIDVTACEDRCRMMYEKQLAKLDAIEACAPDTIDEIDFGTSPSPATVRATVPLPGGAIEADLPVLDGDAVFEGDIVVGSADEIEAAAHKRSVARSNEASRWPRGVIPYTIDTTLPNQTRVTNAIRHWEANTPIRFVPRTTQADYVTFRAGDGCNSRVGRVGGQQIINLAAGCDTGITIHEIGHLVGLWHEQSRADRDVHLIVNWSNIKEAMKSNFKTYAELGNDGMNIDNFDFNSIMLYPSYISDPAFVINPNIPVLRKRDGSTFGAQRSVLSAGDLAAVRRLYRKPAGSIVSLGNKCLEVRGGVTTNRTPLQINDCAILSSSSTAKLAQRWFPQGGTMRSALAPTKVIDMPYAVNNTGVWLFDAWGGANQRFDLSNVQLRTTGGNCVSAVSGVWQSQIQSCANTAVKSKWTYTASKEIRTPDGLCLDVRYWETTNGTPVVAHPCHGGANQKWDLAVNGQIKGFGGKCLDVPGWADRSGVGMQIFDCNGGTNQQFTLRGQIREPGGRCLDLPNGNTFNGTPVNVNACNTGTNQVFEFFP